MHTKACSKPIFYSLLLLLAAASGYAQSASNQNDILQTVLSLTSAESSGDAEKISSLYHPDAVVIGPSALNTIGSRKAIVEHFSAEASKRKPLYFYLRQPKTVMLTPTTALVATNFERGSQADKNLMESNGKAMYLLVKQNNRWVVGAEMVVPNLNTGSYGSLGTPVSGEREFGVFPGKQLSPPGAERSPKLPKQEKELLDAAERITAAWAKGDLQALQAQYYPKGSFSIGDFAAYYLAESDQVQSLKDFYRTSKVTSARTLDPVVRIFGDTAVVSFRFDTSLEVSGQTIHSPGQGAYVLVRSPQGWLMAGCSESSFVLREIGDPWK